MKSTGFAITSIVLVVISSTLIFMTIVGGLIGGSSDLELISLLFLGTLSLISSIVFGIISLVKVKKENKTVLSTILSIISLILAAFISFLAISSWSYIVEKGFTGLA